MNSSPAIQLVPAWIDVLEPQFRLPYMRLPEGVPPGKEESTVNALPGQQALGQCFVEDYNRKSCPFVRVATAESILAKTEVPYKLISGTEYQQEHKNKFSKVRR